MTNKIVLFIALAVGLASCKSDTTNTEVAESTSDSKAFEVKVDRFADIQVLRYQVPGDLTNYLSSRRNWCITFLKLH